MDFSIKTLSNIDRVHRNFFWSKYNNVSGLPLIAWEKICQPKKLGGLGLRKMTSTNTAYLAKWA